MQYEAAKKTRLTKNIRADYLASPRDLDFYTLSTLTSRARYLYNNNSYARKICDSFATNVVSSGMIPQSKFNEDIDLFWSDWANSVKCDYEETNTVNGLTWLMVFTTFLTGNCFTVFKRRKNNGTDVPLEIQLLEADYLDTSIEIFKGNEVKHGIEFKDGKRVAYHFYNKHPNEGLDRKSVRIEAKDVLHTFFKFRPGQILGVTALAPVLLDINDLADYRSTELIKQKISACFTVFYQDAMAKTSDGDIETLSRLEPGLIEKLPPNAEVTFANPPAYSGIDKYTKTTLQSSSGGTGVPYEIISGDLSNVNYSTARFGWLEFQKVIDHWRRELIVPRFCKPIRKEFVRTLEIIGEIKPARKNYLDTWTPPRRELLDPLTEIRASKESIRSGLSSLSEEQRKYGYDPKDLMSELSKDLEKARGMGLHLDCDGKLMSQQGQEQPSLYRTDKEQKTES